MVEKVNLNLWYLLTFCLYKLAFILFVMTPGTQTVVYGSATKKVIYFMVWLANLSQFKSLTVPGVFFSIVTA